jgi:hypothetical protein
MLLLLSLRRSLRGRAPLLSWAKRFIVHAFGHLRVFVFLLRLPVSLCLFLLNGSMT